MAWDDFFTHVEFEYGGQDHLTLEVNKKFSWHLVRILNQIEKEAKLMVLAENSKYSKTGNLRDSIKSDGVQRLKGRRGMITGTVSAGGAKAPYAKYVHEGTKRHIIKAKSSNPTGLLCFKWEGRTGRVSTKVFVAAKNRSKNSREFGTRLDIKPKTGYTTYKNGKASKDRMASGLGGAAAYERLSVRHAFTKEVRKGRRKVNGEWVQNTMLVDAPMLVRQEKRWAQGAIKDRLILTPRVRHPGYEGHPFLRNATRRVVQRYGWATPFGQDRLKPSSFDPKPWGF